MLDIMSNHPGGLGIKTAVYFLWKGYTVVYIGCSKNPEGRISTHSKNKDFDRVTYFYSNWQDGLKVERKLIAIFKPKYNKDHVNGVKISGRSPQHYKRKKLV